MDIFKLDQKDRRLLAELDLDSRQTLAQLGRKAGLSKQVVDYRLKRLVSAGVISSFQTIIDFSKLGYTQYKFYFKFQNADAGKEQEMVDYWVSAKNSIWVAQARGRWDLTVSALARDVNELSVVVDDFMARFALFVQEKSVLLTQRSPVFSHGYLAEGEKTQFVYGAGIGRYVVDDEEQKLLRQLALRARAPIIELAQKTGLTRDVVQYRLKKLVRDGIIVRSGININLPTIGFRRYKVLLRLHSFTQQREAALRYFIERHRHGIQFLKLLGGWDAELEFEFEDEEQLNGALTDLRKQFSDIIRDYDTLFVHTEHKYTFYPF